MKKEEKTILKKKKENNVKRAKTPKDYEEMLMELLEKDFNNND